MVLKRIIPYLIIKKAKAEILLAFCESREKVYTHHRRGRNVPAFTDYEISLVDKFKFVEGA